MTSRYPVPDMTSVSLVEIMKALSDSSRLRIVRALLDGAEHPKEEFLGEFGLHKSTLAHHFKILREAGLTMTLVSGRTHGIQLRRRELSEHFPGLLDLLASAADL